MSYNLILFSWARSAMFVTHRSRQRIATIRTKTSCVWKWGTVSTMYIQLFEKGCLTNGEKLTRLCRNLLLPVMVVFKVEWTPRCFSVVEGNSTNTCVRSFLFLVAESPWTTTEAKPNSSYPYCQSTLSSTLLHFCRGTTLSKPSCITFVLTPRETNFSSLF